MIRIDQIYCILKTLTKTKNIQNIHTRTFKSCTHATVDFSLRLHNYYPVTVNDELIPVTIHLKYFSIYLDNELNWYTDIKRKNSDFVSVKMYWLLRTRNQIFLTNKRLLTNKAHLDLWVNVLGLCSQLQYTRPKTLLKFSSAHMVWIK